MHFLLLFLPKLCQVGWKAAVQIFSPEISTKFTPGLRLGLLQTFTELFQSYFFVIFAECFGLSSFWKMNLLPVWGPECSGVGCCSHLSLDPDKSPGFYCQKTSALLDAAATVLHCRNGIGHVMNNAWFPSDMFLAFRSNSITFASSNQIT